MGVSVMGALFFGALAFSVVRDICRNVACCSPFHENLRSPTCYWDFAKPNIEKRPHCAVVIEVQIGSPGLPVLGAKPREE